MRRFNIIFIIALFSIIIPSAAYAEENKEKAASEPTVLESTISKVTVLPDRAEVIRIASINLKSGVNTFYAKVFESAADLNSLRAKVVGAGDPIINAINIKTIPVPISNLEEYKKALAEIEALRYDIIALENADKVSTYRLTLIKRLLANSKQVFSLKLSQGSADIAAVSKRIDFYAAQELDCLKKWKTINKKIVSDKKRLKELSRRLSSTYGRQNKTETVVSIEIQAFNAGKASIELKYFVSNCSWHPSYEFHYDSTRKQIKVEYHASVTQRTGYNWKDISLTLSTTTPSLQIAPPAHQPWSVSFYVPRPAEVSKMDKKMSRLADSVKVLEKSNGLLEEEMEEDGLGIGATSVIRATGLAVSFEIPDTTSLSSGVLRKFLIGTYSLDSKVVNYMVPRLKDKVYIRAKAKNTSSYPMLPGRAKCFIDGAFTAQTVIGRVDLNGTLKIPLGYENRLKVKRVTILDSVDEKGKKFRHEYHHRLIITNNASCEMYATLMDLLPFSQHEDLKVKGVKLSLEPSIRSDEEILTWNLILAGGEKLVIDIEYYIEYPKDLLPVYE